MIQRMLLYIGVSCIVSMYIICSDITFDAFYQAYENDAHAEMFAQLSLKQRLYLINDAHREKDDDSERLSQKHLAYMGNHLLDDISNQAIIDTLLELLRENKAYALNVLLRHIKVKVSRRQKQEIFQEGVSQANAIIKQVHEHQDKLTEQHKRHLIAISDQIISAYSQKEILYKVWQHTGLRSYYRLFELANKMY